MLDSDSCSCYYFSFRWEEEEEEEAINLMWVFFFFPFPATPWLITEVVLKEAFGVHCLRGLLGGSAQEKPLVRCFNFSEHEVIC